ESNGYGQLRGAVLRRAAGSGPYRWPPSTCTVSRGAFALHPEEPGAKARTRGIIRGRQGGRRWDDLVRTLYGAIFVKGVPQGSYPFLRPSVSLFDLGSPFLRPDPHRAKAGARRSGQGWAR